MPTTLHTVRNAYDDGNQVAVQLTTPSGAPRGALLCVPDQPAPDGPDAYLIVEPGVLHGDPATARRERAARNARPHLPANTTISIDGIAYRTPGSLGEHATTRLQRL